MPTYRYLLPLTGLDPLDAGPLTDAGLTPYRAVKKLLPNLFPGSTMVIGVAGLGQFTVVAIDIDDTRLAIAKDLGSDVVLNSNEEDVIATVKTLIGGNDMPILLNSLPDFTE